MQEHDTNTTPVFLPAGGEASGSTVQPENTYSCIKVTDQVWKSQKIDIWYNEKNCLTTTPHKYQKNRKQQNKPEKVLDVAKITISDLEDSKDEIWWE